MYRSLMSISAVLLGISATTVSTATAQSITLIHACSLPGSATCVAAGHLAEKAAKNKIANLQIQSGKTLTKTMRDVAERRIDITASPFILNFLMSRGLGPYSGLGKEKGKVLADNLRLLYPYHIAAYFLLAFQDTGIDSWDKLKGKNVFNGPPRGGALVGARNIIRLAAGLIDGKDYTGKQIAWGQANSIVMDRSVDAAVRPGTIPADYMPLYMAAGKINMVSIPKAKFESAPFQKYTRAPGNAPVVLPIKVLKGFYGEGARIISSDDQFRTVSNTAGDVVHKNMDKKVAKALTAAFIESLPELLKRAPFAESALFGNIDDSKMGMCSAKVKFHPGAVEAWQEAGYKVAECAIPKS